MKKKKENEKKSHRLGKNICISDKVFMSRINKELLGSNCQKENNPMKTYKILYFSFILYLAPKYLNRVLYSTFPILDKYIIFNINGRKGILLAKKKTTKSQTTYLPPMGCKVVQPF